MPHESCHADRPGKINLSKIFNEIRTYDDIKPHHAEVLNVRVDRDVSLDRMVPARCLPPSHWERDPTDPTNLENHKSFLSSSETLSNGAAIPSHEVFYLRKKELSLSNDEAYNAIGRRLGSINNRSSLRVVHFRKFFESLQIAGTYWDTSRDNFPLPETSKSPTEDANEAMDVDETLLPDPIQSKLRQSPNASLDHLITSRQNQKQCSRSDVMDMDDTSAPDSQQHNQQTKDEHDHCSPADPRTVSTNKFTSESSIEHTYTGRRISTGSSMPETNLDDLVRNFLEPIVWCFGSRIDVPHVNPRLQVQNLLIPVRHSFKIYRAPKDRTKATARILEGPLIGVHCRKEVPTSLNSRREKAMREISRQLEKGLIDKQAFDELANKCERENDESGVSDLLREVGAMLLLGEERDREGREETFPGKQKWWVEKPRWGGGSGVAVAASEGQSSEETKGGVQQTAATDNIRREKKRKTRAAVEAWKGLQGPSSRWERKIQYAHIGKAPSQKHDDVRSPFFSLPLSPLYISPYKPPHSLTPRSTSSPPSTTTCPFCIYVLTRNTLLIYQVLLALLRPNPNISITYRLRLWPRLHPTPGTPSPYPEANGTIFSIPRRDIKPCVVSGLFWDG